jgi:hypothetical protein
MFKVYFFSNVSFGPSNLRVQKAKKIANLLEMPSKIAIV